MDKFPLLWKQTPVGELAVEREALYVCFRADCRLPEEGLWCAWVVGRQGELRLGVLEPEGKCASIRRRFSGQMTAPIGPVLRGELRPAGQMPCWDAAPVPERLFRTLWLRRQLRGKKNARFRREKHRLYLALPYDPAQPFPLPRIFCLARLEKIDGVPHVVYAFDEKEWPVF